MCPLKSDQRCKKCGQGWHSAFEKCTCFRCHRIGHFWNACLTKFVAAHELEETDSKEDENNYL